MSVNGLIVRVQCADCAVLWASRNASRTVAEDLQLLCLPIERADRLVEALACALHPGQLGLDLLSQLGSLVEMRLEDVDFGARLLLSSMPTRGGRDHCAVVVYSAPFAIRMRIWEDVSKCSDGARGKGMARAAIRQFHDDMGKALGWVKMESAEGIRGLKRPKLRLAGALLQQRADDARQGDGAGSTDKRWMCRDTLLIQGQRG